jgi:hypothetical protein
VNLVKIKLLVIAVIMFAASSAFASLSYNVSVDTSTLIGTSGYLYFQLNPNNSNLSDATAFVTSFATDGTLGATAPGVYGGNVSGTLPATVSFDNGYGAGSTLSSINDYNHAITFGNTLSFHLDLTQVLNNPATDGSTFTLSMFNDAMGTTGLLTSTGTELSLILNSDGTATLDQTPGNIATQADVTSTPIPAAAWLLSSGLMGLAGLRRRKA